MEYLLNFNILQKPVRYAFETASVLALVYLLLRPMLLAPRFGGGPGRPVKDPGSEDRGRQPSRRGWLLTVVIALVAGAAAGILTLVICESWLNVFGLPLEGDTRTWVVLAFTAIAVAIANLWRSRWWRKTIASTSIAVFLATAVLGVNADYRLNPTLGALLGMNSGRFLELPKHNPAPAQASPAALWQTWKPPAGMPRTGRTGPVEIPATTSGFHARHAYLYLPPAALVVDPPPLPIIVMMMGQPGSPDQNQYAVARLNALAAKNHGLAPLLLTVDQLGNPYQNPVCVDSPSGNVYSYVTTDVVDFIRTRLNVATGRDSWAVAGYSNGGECALAFAAKRPELFGSLLDISGELKPLNGSVQDTINTIFRGNTAQFTAEEPVTILRAHKYADMEAIFTSGSLDKTFTPQVTTAAEEAKAAGMTTHRFTGDGIGHRGDAVDYGLQTGLPMLCQRFGLTAP